MHCMVFGSDCHSHVARVLDLTNTANCSCHNKVELATAVLFCGRHFGVRGLVSTWLGFVVLCIVYLLTHSATADPDSGL